MRATLSFLRTLLATNLKASFALRGAFWLQAAFMMLNNLVWFSVWWIFFDRFEEVGGWRLADMATLYGIVATAFGLGVVLCGGIRDLARTISDGDLDVYLTQPKDPLLHVVASRSFASGWGDVATGPLLLALSGRLTWESLPLVAVGVVCGAVVFVATGVLFHAAAFWLGPVNSLARQAWEFLIAFSVYPHTIYGGALRLVLFTALPAGFVGFLPVELVRRFSWETLGALVGGACLYATLAVLAFRLGLRRYESGNRFGVRA